MNNWEYRERRKREFLQRREKSWDIVMKEFPEGLTKDNLKQVQKRIKEVERTMKKEVNNESK